MKLPGQIVVYGLLGVVLYFAGLFLVGWALMVAERLLGLSFLPLRNLVALLAVNAFALLFAIILTHQAWRTRSNRQQLVD
jgi:hypothetical protein